MKPRMKLNTSDPYLIHDFQTDGKILVYGLVVRASGIDSVFPISRSLKKEREGGKKRKNTKKRKKNMFVCLMHI